MLEKIKRRLGIEDELQDELLNDLIDDAQSAFKVITGVDTVADKYNFMIINVVLKLYNRKGSEGMESENVDGYSVKYVTGLFDEYMAILDRDFPQDDNPSERRGRVFIY